MNYGKWRAVRSSHGRSPASKIGRPAHYPIAEDIGGGVDRKFQFLFLKHFSWRVQFDYMHTHLYQAPARTIIRGSTGLVWRF